ncbi:hypothetical protein PR001_g715 [Phytophthora rubi]|uniref:Uncharacterized protein n=2 Tax=Phytophthora rubi TaxID=129364 RepID=A0A6A3KSJ3_9STRA|nr:hypothetical protein PR002_g15397 [Phytophthora rubi]KAE9052232.1 hypothetical protein PR001_g715 [Phytophthora rubi]
MDTAAQRHYCSARDGHQRGISGGGASQMTREALDMSLTTRQVFTAADFMATSAPSRRGAQGQRSPDNRRAVDDPVASDTRVQGIERAASTAGRDVMMGGNDSEMTLVSFNDSVGGDTSVAIELNYDNTTASGGMELCQNASIEEIADVEAVSDV